MKNKQLSLFDNKKEYHISLEEAVKIAESDPYVTQIVKADEKGVFTYAMPYAGWWGFAALHTSKKKIKNIIIVHPYDRCPGK